MTNEQKYTLFTELYYKEGILISKSHPEGVRCHIGLGWDEDVDDYISNISVDWDEGEDGYIFDIDEDIDIDELKDTIQYKICIWDSCHESDLGVIYCTCDDIKITDNVLTINTNGKHVYGSMTEYAYDNELEFEMFVPFNK